MNKFILTLVFLSAGSFAENSTVINVRLTDLEKETVSVRSGVLPQNDESNLNVESVSMSSPKVSVGVNIFKGTVNDNIIRLANEELDIPKENVEFMYLPCELVEKYTYVIPEDKFSNKYERLTYYASQYSFFATFSPITNTVTLEYRGPDVFDNCRKAR